MPTEVLGKYHKKKIEDGLSTLVDFGLSRKKSMGGGGSQLQSM